MLHSLIGLPSMLSPPSGQTWVIIDEDLKSGSDVNGRGWKKERAYSDGEGQLDGKTMKEIRELKANWIAQSGTNDGDRGAGGGGRRGNVTAEGDKSKTESTSPSSEPSPSSSSEPLRTIYVFRFPSSSFPHGYSDYYSPDADRQLEWMKKHMIRSLHAGEYFPFGFPHSFLGPLHSFMFSPPIAGLPRHHVHNDQADQALEEIEFQSKMRDALLARRKRCYYEDNIKNQSSIKNWLDSNSETSPQPSFAAQDRKAETKPDPESELELYEHFETVNSTPPHDSLVVSRRPDSSRVVGNSISTQSRTLPDGSSWTKTVKITRFDDGTEERVEEEHSKPPATDYSTGNPSGDRGPPPHQVERELTVDNRRNFSSSNGNSDETGLQTISARRDFFSNRKVWELLSKEISKELDDVHDKKFSSREITKESDCQNDEVLRDTAKANETKSQQGWGWFWKK